VAPAQWALAQLFDGRDAIRKSPSVTPNKPAKCYDEASHLRFSRSLNRRLLVPHGGKKRMFSAAAEQKKSAKNLKANNSAFLNLPSLFPCYNPDRWLTKLYAKTRFYLQSMVYGS